MAISHILFYHTYSVMSTVNSCIHLYHYVGIQSDAGFAISALPWCSCHSSRHTTERVRLRFPARVKATLGKSLFLHLSLLM